MAATLRVAIEGPISIGIAVLIGRIINAADIAIRISVAAEIIRIAVEVRPIISTAPFLSEYPNFF